MPAALLIYPSTESGARVALKVRRADGTATAQIQAIGLDIPAALRALDARSIWSLPEILEIRRVLGHVTAAIA